MEKSLLNLLEDEKWAVFDLNARKSTLDKTIAFSEKWKEKYDYTDEVLKASNEYNDAKSELFRIRMEIRRYLINTGIVPNENF